MADIKLKDFTGETQPYNNVDKIWLESAESTEENPVLIPFAYGLPVSMTVDPNFASGDMNVVIPEGQVVADLRIQKPATLLPRNVLDGVNIAGIIGTATGNIINASGAVIRSGQFLAPNVDRVLYGDTFWDGLNATRDDNGLWKRTVSPAKVKLQKGIRYYATCGIDYKFTEPENHGSFASYGACLTIGNKYLATKRQSDNTGERFLLIYIPRTDTHVELFWDPAHDRLNDGNFTNNQRIEVYIPANSAKTVTIEHGMNTMPDFILVWLSFGSFELEAPFSCVWGIRKELAVNMFNNYVGSYSYGGLGIATSNYGLDSGPSGSPYIYCMDNATFSIPPASNNELLQLSPSSTYRWIAIWGIETD